MLRWDPSEPHLPNVIPRETIDLYPPETIDPWPSYPDPLDDKPYIQHQQRRTLGLTDKTWEDFWAPMVGRYLGEITLMDQMIGRVLDKLDQLGLAEDTLVVYSTDHGDLCGGHGMVDKHYVLYDDVVRVPLTMRWPGTLPAGQVRDDFVTHELDLAATFAKLATGSVPEHHDGVDLLGDTPGAGTTGRADIYCQYFGSQFGLFSQRMVRDRRWKYVYSATAEDELYDLDADPAELKNLAGVEAHEADLMRLRGRLLAWMESADDPLLNTFTRPQLTEAGVKR